MQTNKTYIYPYKNGSASAKALAEALGVKQIKREGSKFIPNANKILINWGSSEIPQAIRFNVGSILNHPEHIDGATNKLKFFRNFLEDNEWTVPFTESKVVAEEWLTNGKIVVARTKLTGHSGEGIVLINPGDAIIDAPLYTQYVPKKDEYRVHCFLPHYEAYNNAPTVFDVQQKKRKNDVADEDVDWKVRNLAGGFIYAREDLIVPQCVTDVAIEVFRQTGLDFAAIDIIYNQQQDRAYALEANTAPGLTGTTLDKYVEMFKELLDG